MPLQAKSQKMTKLSKKEWVKTIVIGFFLIILFILMALGIYDEVFL